MKKKKFYAVKKGVKPGIYFSWDECQKNVLGFSKSQFKSFDTKSEAEDYLAGRIRNSSKVRSSNDWERCNYNSNVNIDIYFDEQASNHAVNLFQTVHKKVCWQEISNKIRSGKGDSILSVRDRITFSLKDGRMSSVLVAAMNPYSSNSVAFVFDNLHWYRTMNVRNINRGGWAKSKMADILEREILTLLPDELVAVIKERNIIQEVNGETYQQKSRLWLPSYTEVFGKQNGCNYADCRDIQFQLFQTEKDRIRMDEEGKTNCYFLRSPVTSNSTAFCSVSSSGTRSSNNASDPLGICPCFIVGK